VSGFYNSLGCDDRICRVKEHFHLPAAFCDPRLFGTEGGGRCVVYDHRRSGAKGNLRAVSDSGLDVERRLLGWWAALQISSCWTRFSIHGLNSNLALRRRKRRAMDP